MISADQTLFGANHGSAVGIGIVSLIGAAREGCFGVLAQTSFSTGSTSFAEAKRFTFKPRSPKPMEFGEHFVKPNINETYLNSQSTLTPALAAGSRSGMFSSSSHAHRSSDFSVSDTIQQPFWCRAGNPLYSAPPNV